MPFDFLLLPLLGGYLFITRFNGLRFEAKRLNGQRLLLLSALAGTALLACSYLVVKAIIFAAPWVHLHWKSIFPYNNLGVTAGALFLGIFGGDLLNPLRPTKPEMKKTIAKWEDHLELLFYKATTETKQVLIDLKNGKVYVGFVLSSPNPEYERRFVRLLPTISGYRDKEDMSLHLATNYLPVYLKMMDSGQPEDQALADDFQIVIAASEIISAHIFNEDAYQTFNPVIVKSRS